VAMDDCLYTRKYFITYMRQARKNGPPLTAHQSTEVTEKICLCPPLHPVSQRQCNYETT